jgi:hypothetical protein
MKNGKKSEIHEKGDSKGEIIVYQSDEGEVRLDVRLEGETVWLTQQMLAELFQTTVPNISMHIRNIYQEGELDPKSTIKKFLTVRLEGKMKRSIWRSLKKRPKRFQPERKGKRKIPETRHVFRNKLLLNQWLISLF